MAAALEMYPKCCGCSEKVTFNVGLKGREGFIEEGLFELHVEEWVRTFLKGKQAVEGGDDISSFRAFRKTLTEHLTDAVW